MPKALTLALTPPHERRAHYAALRVGVKAGFGCVRLGFIGTTLLMLLAPVVQIGSIQLAFRYALPGGFQ